MTWLDGELSAAEAQAVADHVDDCAECSVMAEQFRATSLSLASWSVPESGSNLDEAMNGLVAKTASAAKSARPTPSIRINFWNWKTVALGGAALALLLIVAAFVPTLSYRHQREMAYLNPDRATTSLDTGNTSATGRSDTSRRSGSSNAGAMRAADVNQFISAQQIKKMPLPSQPLGSIEKLAPGVLGRSAGALRASAGGGGGGSAFTETPVPAPMIARTVSLTILVKDFAASRASLDTILTRHSAYSAQLTVSTPENEPRSFQASLRIPAPELGKALAELRSLGRVQNETQSGEEVTQQHADLVARLKNSREEETRLQAILQQRTGKIEDVLQVEEEIASVRGEIETMEAQQQALEHRVDFASVDIQLTEEYKAELSSPEPSAVTEMRNAFVAGLRHAAGMVLGTILFFEEYGPVILIWLGILAVPLWFAWRHYLKVHSEL
jgi:hypothetical protein